MKVETKRLLNKKDPLRLASEKFMQGVAENPQPFIEEALKWRAKKDPTKLEQTENLVWVFLNTEMKNYQKAMKSCIELEDGIFEPYLKGCVTMLMNTVSKNESEIDKKYKRGYTTSKADEFIFQIKGRYVDKAFDRNNDTILMHENELQEKLGIEGYEMYKSFIALKSCYIYISEKINVKNEELKKFISNFKKLINWWEKSVMV